MDKQASQIEALIHTLKVGPPRTAYLARQELIRTGRAAEDPLIDLLREVNDTHQILDILGVLQKIKIASPIAVDTIVSLLSRKQHLIRRAAAYCLLFSSPKLRQQLPQIRVAFTAEKDDTIREVLQKLLERYPNSDRIF
jgi:hypothetical protein